MDEDTKSFVKLFSGIAIAILCTIGLGMAGCPAYNVYEQEMSGKAELAKADFSKKVAVQEAQAKKDSAQLLADSEIIRAGGVAKANQIIGDSLKGNDAYLRYLWIDKLDSTKGQIVYVPTEAGLPILEAGRNVNK